MTPNDHTRADEAHRMEALLLTCWASLKRSSSDMGLLFGETDEVVSLRNACDTLLDLAQQWEEVCFRQFD